MREILFRAKNGNNAEWVYGHYVHQYGADMIYLPDGTDKEYGFDYYHIIPKTVGQYTGLTDKHGKKIFEGDIVKCRHNWHLRVYPRTGIDEREYFFAQKIRGAYGKSEDKENIYLPCDRYYYFRNYAIEYFARNGGFRVRNGGQFHPLTQTYILNRSLEVIGNIHDNPELLKGGAE